MLQSFRVDNFKTLTNFTFEPQNLNLLLGQNNAGKTNLCLALRFLSMTARMPLDAAAEACTREPWNLPNVHVKNPRLSFSVTCDLALEGEPLAFTYDLTLIFRQPIGPRQSLGSLAVASETLKATGGPFQSTLLLENNAGSVRLLHEPRALRSDAASYVDTKASTDATMLFRLYDLQTNQRSNLFKKYLASWQYYALEPGRLREIRGKPFETILAPDGANLSSVLFNLHNARPRTERALIDALKLIEPRLDLFSFQNPDPEHVYMFFEDARDNKFGVHSTSDGTLRFLGLSYLLVAQSAQSSDSGGSPLIMIEEPENGIYVELLRTLFEKVDRSGRAGQFIFTSHNPYFIDLFESALEGVFLMKGADTHSTLTRPDAAKLRERLQAGTFSLGEMHFRGLLE